MKLRKLLLALILGSALGLLAGCDSSKDDILQKAAKAETGEELRKALGDPDEVSKVGPIETWTYKANDGTVTFTLAAGTVTLSTTGEKSE
jgi:hypothetical protein